MVEIRTISLRISVVQVVWGCAAVSVKYTNQKIDLLRPQAAPTQATLDPGQLYDKVRGYVRILKYVVNLI
jgi:hypothetical protein